jgi:hypothetical protein
MGFKGAFMRVSSWFLRIIGLCAIGLLLAGCSAVKLGYSQLPEIAYWWIDSYIDTTDAQSRRLRAELDELAQWHRSTELPQIVLMLQKMQRLAPGPISPAQACTEFEGVRERFHALAARSEGLVLWLAPSLSPAQIDHLAAKYAKTNTAWEADWQRGTPEDSLKRRLKQAVERSEMLYGSLDQAQIQLLRSELAASSFDAKMLGSERLRRQEDILQTLRRVTAGTLPQQGIREALKALQQRLLTSPVPAGRAYSETVVRENCALFSRLHNSTTPAQRARAVENLKHYEDDFRALIAGR